MIKGLCSLLLIRGYFLRPNMIYSVLVALGLFVPPILLGTGVTLAWLAGKVLPGIASLHHKQQAAFTWVERPQCGWALFCPACLFACKKDFYSLFFTLKPSCFASDEALCSWLLCMSCSCSARCNLCEVQGGSTIGDFESGRVRVIALLLLAPSLSNVHGLNFLRSQ